MTFEALRCLCAVVEAGTFRAAAGRVHRSQPAVSQQIKALERETGHTLIERKTARPTPLGERLYHRARTLLQEMDSLAREAADFDESATQELRVGTSDTTALYLFPGIVRRFAAALPQTRLVLVNRSSDAIAALVRRGDLDFGIVTLPQRHPELREEELFQQHMVLVTPAGHSLARARRVKLADLAAEPLLLIDEHTRTGALLRDYFAREQFVPQVVLDSGSFEVIKRYIAEGIGLSFLPASVITDADRHLATRELPGLPRVPIGAIWRKGAYRSRAETTFLSLLRRV